jgi:hypothetical protein
MAAEQAQIAAANALGDSRQFEPVPPATMLKVVGVELTSIGRYEPQSPDEIVIALEEPEQHRYRKLVIADGRIVGAILFGYPLLAPAVTGAVKKNVDVTPVLDALRAGDWEILDRQPAGAPPAVARPVAAPAAPAARAEAAPVAAPPASPPEPATAPIPLDATPVARRSEPEMQAISSAPARPATRLLLRGQSGPAAGITYEVQVAGGTLGRTPENRVHIADSKLSRQHARIEYRDGVFILVDLESTNGTFLNYRKLEGSAPISTGDVIGVGGSRLVVEVE